MNERNIEVQQRARVGKNWNRRLRAAGKLPAVVYGDGQDTLAIEVSERKVRDLLKGGGENAVFLLQLEGTDQQRHAMIRELQVDPVSGEMLHIDFQRINMKRSVQVHVPIEVHGKAHGVRNEGGILEFVTREVQVECLPDRIPAHLEIDVTELQIGQHVEAGELELPEGVELIGDRDKVIVSVGHPRVVEVEEEPEEERLIEEEAEEPEVIQRGKAESEEEED